MNDNVEIDSGCGWPWAAIPPQEEPVNMALGSELVDKLSKAIQALEDQINYSVRNMDEVSVELDFESADVILELLKEKQPKKGHWQPYKYGDDTWHQCSVCGVADRYINIVKRDEYPDNRMVCKRNFCPNCGADMRGEQE